MSLAILICFCYDKFNEESFQKNDQGNSGKVSLMQSAIPGFCDLHPNSEVLKYNCQSVCVAIYNLNFKRSGTGRTRSKIQNFRVTRY